MVKMRFHQQDAKLFHNRLFEHYQRCVGCRGNYVGCNNVKLYNKIQSIPITKINFLVHTQILCYPPNYNKIIQWKSINMLSYSDPWSKCWDSALKYATPTSFLIHHAIQQITRGELEDDKVVSNKKKLSNLTWNWIYQLGWQTYWICYSAVSDGKIFLCRHDSMHQWGTALAILWHGINSTRNSQHASLS
jgi:hypothetical protein